jgi:non-canonical (house-cleaning) NTP pyrophosphatase
MRDFLKGFAMPRYAVGSKNAGKIQAVRDALIRYPDYRDGTVE